jgi:ABC-type nitrate/sulfonate/bicarbonate transport system substrate-binding protein
MRRYVAVGLVLGVLAVVLVPPGSFGAASFGSAPPVKIAVAQGFVAPFAIGVWIAGAHGIFVRNGLDVDVSIVNSTQAMQALISGSVQVMLGSPGQGLAANAAGADVVEVATLAPRIAYRMVGRGITRPEELRGKRLGTSGAGLSTDRAAMIVYLRSIGLNPNDNTFVNAGPPAQRLVAITGGGIDATVIDPAQWLAADRAGLSLVADLTTLKIPWDHDVVQTTRQYVNTHRPVIAAFVRSLVEANAFILAPANKPAVIESLSRHLKIDPTLTGDLELNYQLTTKLYTVRKPYPSPEAARTLIENLRGDFPDLVKVNLGAYVDRSFVRALDESGYIDRLYK